jgi:hypothetical protein
MPKVGKKHFSYSKKGVSEAKKAASKTGKPLKMYRKGGKVRK